MQTKGEAMSNPKFVRKFTALFIASLMVFAYVPRGWGKESAAVVTAKNKRTTGFATQSELDLLSGKSASAPKAGNSYDIHYGDAPKKSDFNAREGEHGPTVKLEPMANDGEHGPTVKLSPENDGTPINNLIEEGNVPRADKGEQYPNSEKELAEIQRRSEDNSGNSANESKSASRQELANQFKSINFNRTQVINTISAEINKLSSLNSSDPTVQSQIESNVELVKKVEACVATPIQQALDYCYEEFENNEVKANLVLSTIEGLNGEIAEQKKDSINPFSGATTSFDASKKFSIVEADIGISRTLCKKKMQSGSKSFCNTSCDIDGASKLKVATLKTAGDFLISSRKICGALYNDGDHAILSKFDQTLIAAHGTADSAMDTYKALRNTLAAVAVVAVVNKVVNDRKESRDNEAKADKAANNAANAVIQTAAGQVDCRAASGSGITNPDCKAPLMSYCSNPQKAKDVGCAAFDKSICASGGSASYCVGKQADEYCDRSNAGLADSPSCMWMKERPSSCRSQPDDIKCMSNISQADLKSKCEKFNNDPLCRASASGQMVLQPNSGSGVPDLSGASRADSTSRTPSSDLNLSQSTSEAHRWMCQQGLVADCTLPQ
jgi:hypothetical protein